MLLKNTMFKVSLLMIFLIPSSVWASELILKSGQKFEGKIVEQTDKYVKFDTGIIPVTYYADQIDTLDGQKLQSPAPLASSSPLTPSLPTSETKIEQIITIEVGTKPPYPTQEIGSNVRFDLYGIAVKDEDPDAMADKITRAIPNGSLYYNPHWGATLPVWKIVHDHIRDDLAANFPKMPLSSEGLKHRNLVTDIGNNISQADIDYMITFYQSSAGHRYQEFMTILTSLIADSMNIQPGTSGTLIPSQQEMDHAVRMVRLSQFSHQMMLDQLHGNNPDLGPGVRDMLGAALQQKHPEEFEALYSKLSSDFDDFEKFQKSTPWQNFMTAYVKAQKMPHLEIEHALGDFLEASHSFMETHHKEWLSFYESQLDIYDTKYDPQAKKNIDADRACMPNWYSFGGRAFTSCVDKVLRGELSANSLLKTHDIKQKPRYLIPPDVTLPENINTCRDLWDYCANAATCKRYHLPEDSPECQAWPKCSEFLVNVFSKPPLVPTTDSYGVPRQVSGPLMSNQDEKCVNLSVANAASAVDIYAAKNPDGNAEECAVQGLKKLWHKLPCQPFMK